MPEFGPYGGYILASYAVAGLVLGAMIIASVLHWRSATARLGALEAIAGRGKGRAR